MRELAGLLSVYVFLPLYVCSFYANENGVCVCVFNHYFAHSVAVSLHTLRTIAMKEIACGGGSLQTVKPYTDTVYFATSK